MKALAVQFALNPNLYLKDPLSSELGEKILSGSIDLIDELGFESFTLRKLASKIGSTEASIYRYFESKHKVLLYLTSWYWSWLEYRLQFRLANIPSATDRLRIAITALTESIKEDGDFAHINEVKLNRIVISESSKCYLTKDVDAENKAGTFAPYKRLVGQICDVIKEVNSKYAYPHMLVSAMIEGAHVQRFFADHIPNLTDTVKGEDSVTSFYQSMIFGTLAASLK